MLVAAAGLVVPRSMKKPKNQICLKETKVKPINCLAEKWIAIKIAITDAENLQSRKKIKASWGINLIFSF